jgi:hypothetical protein
MGVMVKQLVTRLSLSEVAPNRKILKEAEAFRPCFLSEWTKLLGKADSGLLHRRANDDGEDDIFGNCVEDDIFEEEGESSSGENDEHQEEVAKSGV